MNMNEQSIGIYTLETLNNLVSQAKENEEYWPWIIISAHSALQSFMVCALRGSNNLRVLRKNSMFKWIEEFAKRTEYNVKEWKQPKEDLDSFPSLFEKTQSDAMLFYTISKKLEPSPEQIKNIKRLNFLRNEIVHFVPSFWELETRSLPILVQDVVDLIKFFINESGNIVWLEEEFKQRALTIIASIENELADLFEDGEN